jgi:mono/diheme cytochrome c family protein
MKARRLFALVIFGSAFLFLASGASGEQDYAQKPVPTKEIFLQGRTIYQKQCLVCHGGSGAGDGKAAYLLYPKPRDFMRNEFRLVSTNDMQATDEDLFKAISQGMPGSSMPSWNHLSETDRWALVYYIRGFAELNNFKQSGEITDEMLKKELPWPTVQKMLTKKIDPESLVKITSEPKVTQERLRLGKELFVKGCAACHGVEGRGDGLQVMADSLGYPIKPRDLTAGIFKGSSSSEDLYYRIAGGIPGSPMPGYQLAFKDEEIWNLVHYVQTLPKPGMEERSRVKKISFIAKRVDQIDEDPSSSRWASVESVYVALTPLWWRNERIEGVEIKSAHDGKKIAFHLSWKDTTKDSSNVEIQSFSDGAAIQFIQGKDIPSFAMGSVENPVTIWNWKAAWQEDLAARKDIETAYPNTSVDWYEAQKNYEKGTPIEMAETSMRFHDPKFITGWGAGNPLSDPERKSAGETASAAGIGSLTTKKVPDNRVNIKGVWKNDQWSAVFVRELKAIDRNDIGFSTGGSVSVAFAVWDGSKRDRNGQKMVSIWNEVTLEK